MKKLALKKNAINYKNALTLLRKKYNIQFLDITAGGRTICAMALHKLIDEFRVTMAGQLAGDLSSESKIRPTIFPLVGSYFTHETNPIIKYKKVGIYGFYHIFIRGEIEYRHEEYKTRRKRNGVNSNGNHTSSKKSKIS